MYIIAGFIILAIGALIVIKSEMMLNAFGRIQLFEHYLGAEGGSRLGYKVVGLTVIFIGILIMTNMIGGFLEWTLSPLLKFNQVPR